MKQLNPSLVAGLLFMAGISLSVAATLRLSDEAGSSSLTGSTNWNPTGVPSGGNAYFTAAFTIRTTNSTTSGGSIVFAGDSLSVDTGGRMIGKSGNNVAANFTSNAITVANLILNG